MRLLGIRPSRWCGFQTLWLPLKKTQIKTTNQRVPKNKTQPNERDVQPNVGQRPRDGLNITLAASCLAAGFNKLGLLHLRDACSTNPSFEHLESIRCHSSTPKRVLTTWFIPAAQMVRELYRAPFVRALDSLTHLPKNPRSKSLTFWHLY